MPLIRRTSQIMHPRHSELVTEMVRHIKTKDSRDLPPVPRIVEEMDRVSKTLNVYVLWQEWESVTQQDRAEMILEAYEQTQGSAAVRRISIAMGLAPLEAQTLGLDLN